MEQYKTQQIVIQKNSIRIEMALLKLDQSPFPLYLYSFISSWQGNKIKDVSVLCLAEAVSIFHLLR